MAPKISVVVPVHDGEKSIGGCIESLLGVEYPAGDLEILVVDNCSRDGTAGIVRRYPVHYLFQPRPGAAAARNMGIRHASGEYIAFTDADCTVDPRWLSELSAAFDDGRVACVGGMIRNPPAATDYERYLNQETSISQENAIEKKVILFPHVVTANAMFRKTVFEKVGCFDERFPTAGGEDLELGWRIHWAGYMMRYAGAAVVEHRHKSRIRDLFRQYYRYGFTWIIVRRKHPALFSGAPPSWCGICGEDLRLLSQALTALCDDGLSPRRRHLSKRHWYHLVRLTGNCAGKLVASVRL